MQPLEEFLFLFVVGGRFPKKNIELNDSRWAIGTKIKYLFDPIKK